MSSFYYYDKHPPSKYYLQEVKDDNTAGTKTEFPTYIEAITRAFAQTPIAIVIREEETGNIEYCRGQGWFNSWEECIRKST